MRPVARINDVHDCPMHGKNVIVTGQFQGTTEERAIACVGDLTACGGTIVTGSSISSINGKPIAYLGSKTSCGGVITTGSSNTLIQQ